MRKGLSALSLGWSDSAHKDEPTHAHTNTRSNQYTKGHTHVSCKQSPPKTATWEQKQYHLISCNSYINFPDRWRDAWARMACVYSGDTSNLSSQLNIQYSATLPLWTVQFHDAFDGSTSKLNIIAFNSNILIHFLCLGFGSYRCCKS